jgi:hypothetical protein
MCARDRFALFTRSAAFDPTDVRIYTILQRPRGTCRVIWVYIDYELLLLFIRVFSSVRRNWAAGLMKCTGTPPETRN